MRTVARRITPPRLLPATIVAIAALLGMKTVALVRAATPAAAAGNAAAGAGPMGAGTIGAPGAARAAAAAREASRGTSQGGTSQGGTSQGGTSPGGASPGGASQVPPPDSSMGPAPPPAVSPTERALLLDLAQRRKILDSRAAALTARESVLAAAERRLDQRIGELKALEARLQGLETARQRRKDAAWSGLVSLYQSMKPRQAAKIFDQLKMSVLLAVVDRMDARRAAAILAAMQPDRAREVTDRLAALRLRRDAAAAPAAPTPQGRS